MKANKSDYDKKLDRTINKIKKATQELQTFFGLKLFIDKNAETMMGSSVDNVYVVDSLKSGRVCFQKHLFTVRN